MKKTMKKIIAISLCFVMLMSLVLINVSALEEATTALIFSTKSPKVGNDLTITVSLTADSNIEAISGTLGYDSTILKYKSSTGQANNTGETIMFNKTSTSSKVISVSFTFNVISEGTVTVSAKNCKASDGSVEVDAAAYSYTITATKTGSQNNDKTMAYITSVKLTGGTMTPAFSSTVTEYTIVVPYTQTDGLISCETKDQNAKITIEGSRELKVGLNKRVITVVATNGAQMKYTFNFNRLDENGRDTTSSVADGENKVTVNGNEYFISQSDASVVPPKGFSLATMNFEGSEVAGYKDDFGSIVIFYLVSSSNEGGFYLYENGAFSPLKYIEGNTFTYILKDTDINAPDGFYKSSVEINGNTVNCYKYTDASLSDFVVVKATTTKGNSNYYRYDTAEGTLQRLINFENGVVTNNSQNQDASNINIARALLIIAALIILAIIVLVIILIISKNKKENVNY